MLSFKPAFSLSFFTFIKRLFSSSSLFAIKVVSSSYLRLLVCLPAILIPACDSSSPGFHMMFPWTAACRASLSFTIFWVGSNSSPLSHWCYLTILSSAALFSGGCLPTPTLHWWRIIPGDLTLWTTSRARDHALTYGRADRSVGIFCSWFWVHQGYMN